jgi:hypothetical protein
MNAITTCAEKQNTNEKIENTLQEQYSICQRKHRVRYKDYPYCLYNSLMIKSLTTPLPGSIRLVKRMS